MKTLLWLGIGFSIFNTISAIMHQNIDATLGWIASACFAGSALNYHNALKHLKH